MRKNGSVGWLVGLEVFFLSWMRLCSGCCVGSRERLVSALAARSRLPSQPPTLRLAPPRAPGAGGFPSPPSLQPGQVPGTTGAADMWHHPGSSPAPFWWHCPLFLCLCHRWWSHHHRGRPAAACWQLLVLFSRRCVCRTVSRSLCSP